MEREQVLSAVEAALGHSLERCQSELAGLQASLAKETKSTAGDKHETGRAMVQLDIEQAGERLARIEAMMALFKRLDPQRHRDVVGPGACVETDSGSLFIGVPLGAVDLPGGGRLQAISSDAPLALALRGSRTGATVEFRGRSWQIRAVH